MSPVALLTWPFVGVSKNWGIPKWMVMENPIKMDDLRVPLFLETPFAGNEGMNPLS